VEWWRSGDPALRQKVADYCKMDVELTRDIYLFGKEKGFVRLRDLKTGETRQIPVSW
jgi:DEAD/DEAH box helicase domain-containing protein